MGLSVKSFKKKFKKYTGLQFGGAAMGSLFGPVGVVIGGKIGPSVEDFINDPTGAKAAAKEQERALIAAGKKEEAYRLKLEAARNQIIAETAGFREYGRGELERLRTQRPGETEFYKQALERGTESLVSEANKYGLVSGGGTRRKMGYLASDLLLQEEVARQQGIGRAAQLSQVGYGAGLNLLQQEGGATYREAQTAASIAAIKAQGKMANRNFWLNLGTQAGGLALGYAAGGPAGAAAGGAAGGAATSGGYGSPYTLQQGTGYSQFLNPYN